MAHTLLIFLSPSACRRMEEIRAWALTNCLVEWTIMKDPRDLFNGQQWFELGSLWSQSWKRPASKCLWQPSEKQGGRLSRRLASMHLWLKHVDRKDCYYYKSENNDGTNKVIPNGGRHQCSRRSNPIKSRGLILEDNLPQTTSLKQIRLDYSSYNPWR